MNFKCLFLFSFLVLITACKKENHLYKIEGQQISINDELETDSVIENLVKPYREHINKDLDSVLAYAVDTYLKKDGEFNTAIGNLMADIVYEQANPVFESRTKHSIDFVLLNHGGIRAPIHKGDITSRTAYKIMPFDNSIVVVKLPGKNVKDLLTYLSKAKKAHPISNHLQLTLDKNFDIKSATINNNPIDFNTSYFVATNDYLYNGGDRMSFFKPNDSLYLLDYKIRNALIDYFKKVDTIKPVIDNRFIQLKN